MPDTRDVVPLKNGDSERAPPHCFLMSTGEHADDGSLIVVRPTGDSMPGLLVNGLTSMEPGESGSGTLAVREAVAYDGRAGEPEAGDDFGSVAGSWYAAKGKTGFVALSGGKGVANVVRTEGTKTRKEFFFARCDGSDLEGGYNFTRITMTGPGIWGDSTPPLSDVAYRTPSDLSDDLIPLPPDVTSGETILVQPVTYPPLSLPLTYTADPETGIITFSFSPSDSYTADIDWGDGTTSTGVVVPADVPHDYSGAGPGPWVVVVTVTLAGVPTRTEDKTFTVPAIPTDTDPVTPSVDLGPPTDSYQFTPWGSELEGGVALLDAFLIDDDDEPRGFRLVRRFGREYARDMVIVPITDPYAGPLTAAISMGPGFGVGPGDYVQASGGGPSMNWSFIGAGFGGRPPYSLYFTTSDGQEAYAMTLANAAASDPGYVLLADGRPGSRVQCNPNRH
jgi:hypothetical protein